MTLEPLEEKDSTKTAMESVITVDEDDEKSTAELDIDGDQGSKVETMNSNDKGDKTPPPSNMFQQNPTDATNDRNITVSWRNLMYTVERRQISPGNCPSMTKTTKRTILKGINGHFQTGQLTAVMGPSGSGKSTMLECIVGFRKRGLSGQVRVTSNDPENNVKVALISQTDFLIEVFTVREMLVYASRLKNYAKDIPEEEPLEGVITTVNGSMENHGGNVSSISLNESKRNLIAKNPENYHQRLAVNVINRLGLGVCADTRAANCSGGQKKRISIGLEMISKPNILILDEPTSGLDSSACYQTVLVMQKLTRETNYPTAVVATIHQPSSRVFNLFDHLYILSYNGYCIYQGSPREMLDHLLSVDLVCPQFHNPADFIAEVAAGEHGTEAVDRLIEVKERNDLSLAIVEGSDRTLAQYSEKNSYPTFLHIWILLQRTTLQTMRDPMLNWLRFLSHVSTALFIGLLYGEDVGKPSLCPPVESPLNDLDNFGAYRVKYQNDLVTSTENLAFIFFTLMFIMFGSMMPIIMTFPSNLNVLRKEKINGWYSVASYYVALSISEIPFQIIYPFSFVAISYIMTGQLLSPIRFSLFLAVCILMAFVSQSQGLLIGALFMSDASAAVFLGPITTVPIMLFGGFFVRLSTVPDYLYPLSYISYIRYAFELMVMIIYGLDRCQLDPAMLNMNVSSEPEWKGMASMVLGEGADKFVDSFARSLGGTYDPHSGKKYTSTIINQFNIIEDEFYHHFVILVIFLVVIRLLTYFVVIFKLNKRD